MTKRIVLAGGGHAHLGVLRDWIASPLHDVDCCLVTSDRFTAYSGMLPGWMAGHYDAEALQIDLAPLARAAGARLVIADVVAVDPDRRTLALSSGDHIGFDLLSLATGGATDISTLAALGDRLLAVRPVGPFMARWQAFRDARACATATHVAVIGAGAAGVELAFAADTALRGAAGAVQVSLVAPHDSLLAGHSAAVRKRVAKLLKRRGIARREGHAIGESEALLLSDRSRHFFDIVIAATGSRAPEWLRRSGLATSAEGFVLVGADLRSVSHPGIFAAGDIIERCDRDVERSGVHAVKAGPVLATNLRAALKGLPLTRYIPRRRTLYLLATGDRRAILSWGPIVIGGRMVWRLKDWIDRRFVDHYARVARSARDGVAAAGIDTGRNRN